MAVRMLKDLTIGARLGLGFGVVFVLFCALTIFAINRMQYLANETSQIFNHPLTVSNAALRVDENIAKIHSSIKDLVTDKGLAEIERNSRLIDGFEADVYADFDTIGKWFLGDKRLFEAARKAFVSWKPIRDKVIKLMRAGKRKEAVRLTKSKGREHMLKVENTAHILNAFAQSKADEFVASARATTNQSIRALYLLLSFLVVAMALFTFYLTRSITRPLKALRVATLEIGKGKFDTPLDIETDGEIGALALSVHEMANNLSQITASRDALNREIVERKKLELKLKNSEERINPKSAMAFKMPAFFAKFVI